MNPKPNPTPYTLYHEPFTLNPKPGTLHLALINPTNIPSFYTLNPKP